MTPFPPAAAPIDASAALPPKASRVPELRLMKIRVVLVVGATFVIALFIGGGLVALGVPGVAALLAMLVRSAPRAAIVALPVAFVLAIALIAWMGRAVIRPAEQLATSRNDLGTLYESARSHALEDSLTGLANHRAFQEEFESLLALSIRHRLDLALLLIDIDDFKTVNDSAGHAVGDDLLIEMGRILRGQLRASDRVYRIGGDEFAILLPHTDADNARLVANRLLAACVEPRTAGEFRRGFAFSGGLTAAPAFASNRDQLLNQADEALYQAKRDGRCLVRIFDAAMSKGTLDIRVLNERSAAVADVLNGGGLWPVFQPVIDLRNGEVLAFEGLARLPDGTPFRDPGVLFEAAEAAGRTYELDLACITSILNGARTIDRRLAQPEPLAADPRNAGVRTRTIRRPAVHGRLGATTGHHRAHRAGSGSGHRAAAARPGATSSHRDADRRRRRRCRECRPAVAQPDPLRHRQAGPGPRPGGSPTRELARRSPVHR
jgi:diguanylate cyclase (GGDEF)-like protein